MSKLENNISILEKRKLQAEVAKSIFEEMKTELGENKAKKILNWEPTIKIEEGIDKTFNYFKHIIKNEK